MYDSSGFSCVDGFHGTIETTTVYYFPIAICGILFWYILSIQINKNRILEYMELIY